MTQNRLDDMIDREIAAVLHEAPSPGFTARVRQRVAAAPARTWPGMWALASAAALAAAALGVAVTFDESPADGPPAPALTRRDVDLPPAAVTIEPSPTTQAAAPRVQLAPASRAVSRDRVAAADAPPAERRDEGPEVVLSSAENAALRRIFASTGSARVVPWAPEPLSAPSDPVLPPEAVAVARIEIARVNVEPVVLTALQE